MGVQPHTHTRRRSQFRVTLACNSIYDLCVHKLQVLYIYIGQIHNGCVCVRALGVCVQSRDLRARERPCHNSELCLTMMMTIIIGYYTVESAQHIARTRVNNGHIYKVRYHYVATERARVSLMLCVVSQSCPASDHRATPGFVYATRTHTRKSQFTTCSILCISAIMSRRLSRTRISHTAGASDRFFCCLCVCVHVLHVRSDLWARALAPCTMRRHARPPLWLLILNSMRGYTFFRGVPRM